MTEEENDLIESVFNKISDKICDKIDEELKELYTEAIKSALSYGLKDQDKRDYILSKLHFVLADVELKYSFLGLDDSWGDEV